MCKARSSKTNLVFFLVDQLRLQSCGYAGDRLARTPHIDRLALNGMSFLNAVSSDPVCGPYRASLMTGKYPSTTGMVINEMRMNPNHDCLAHVLTRSDYDTAYIGKWHLWSNQTESENLPENGFVPPGPARLGFDGHWAAYNFNFDYFHTHYFLGDGTRLIADSYETEFTTKLGMDWLLERKSDRPFALFLSYGPPHDPWEWTNVPERFARVFSIVDFPFPLTYRDGSAEYWEPSMNREWWLGTVKPNLSKWQAVYAAMVASIDEACGTLLDYLRQSHLTENTLFVFTSDHGEMFGAHGRMAKNIFYEEAIRVPFVAYWPGQIEAGSRCFECLGTPDIMPTLLGALGLETPVEAEGVDLSPHLFGRPAPEKDEILLQGMGHTWMWLDGFEWRGLRTKRYTYAIERADGAEYFFDNLADPLQQRNLVQESAYSDARERIKNRMLAKMNELGDEFRSCSWYGKNWIKDRVVLRGSKG
jgi:arylsulfatase A-like enzyme